MKKEDKYYARYCDYCPYQITGNFEYGVVRQFEDHIKKKHKKKAYKTTAK